MGQQHYERRGQEFADNLHERARISSYEYRKILMSLSTGSLAIFFIFVTEEIKPGLTEVQLWTIISALLFMSIAVFAGLVCLYADSQRNYYWAKVEEGKQVSGGPEYDAMGKTWKNRLYFSTSLQIFAFSLGVAISIVFIVERLFH